MLQWSLDGILFFLVIFTPLAFGSVEHWGVAIIEWGAVVALLLWSLLTLQDDPAGGAAALPSRIYAPVRRAGVGAALIAFLCVVVVQLLPLPPALMRLLSPATYRIYETTLPDYAAGRRVDFDRVESWLLQGAGAESVSASDLPWKSGSHEDLTFTRWRPLSMVPSATRHNLGLFAAYLLLFIIVADRARAPQFVGRFLWTIAFTGVLVAFLGLAQKTSWGGLLYGQVRPAYGGQPMGPFVNPNHFAGYLELALPVLLGLWIAHLRREAVAGKRRHRTGTAEHMEQSYVPKLFMFSMLLLVGGLAFWGSRSRGGVIAMALAIGVLGLPALLRWSGGSFARKAAILVALLMVAAAVGWKVQSLTVEESMESNLTSEPSMSKRFEIWWASAKMLLRFIPLGTGLGTYGYIIPLYQGGGYDRLWIYAHNDYVQLACEVGLLGIACFLAGFVVFLVRILGSFLRTPLQRGGAALGCALGVCSLLFHALVDFNLQIPSNGLLFVLLSGILVVYVSGAPPTVERRTAADPEAGRRISPGILALLVGTGIGVCALTGVHVAARTLQSRATAQYWGGNAVEAERNLGRAIALAPALPDLQADYGFLILRALEEWDGAGRRLGIDRQEALRRARDAFCRAINLNPVNTFFWSGLAEVYRHASLAGLLEGTRDIGALLELAPGTGVEDRLYLAVLRRMMKLEPQNPYHHARLGDFFTETGNLQNALATYETAVRLLPKVEEHPFLGGQAVPAEVLSAAIRGIEQAVSENRSGVPEHEMHLNASLLYERIGDPKAALSHMEKAQKLLPRKEWYSRRLGSLYFHAGDLDRSRQFLVEALKLGTRSEYPYILLASIARKQGDLQVALENYRKALGANPENARVAMDLAALYDEMGDQRNANRYYDLAVEIKPGDVTTLISVADYYTRRGLVARSIPIIEKVVSLRPHDEVYKERLEQLRARAVMLR